MITTADIIVENYNNLYRYCDMLIYSIINTNGKWNENGEYAVNLSDRIGRGLISFTIDKLTYVVRGLSLTDGKIKVYCMFYDNDTNVDYETEVLFDRLSLDNKVLIIEGLNKHYRKLLKWGE